MGRSNIHARFQKKLNFTLKMVSIEVRPEDITSLIIVLRSLEVLVFPKVLEEYYFQSKNLECFLQFPYAATIVQVQV